MRIEDKILLAIDRNFGKSPILPLIMAAQVRYMMGRKCKYIISRATFPEPGNLFCKMGPTRIDFPEFKYHLNDPNPVSLVVFSLEEKDNFQKLFRVTDKLIKRGKAKEFDINEFNPQI
ncbi:MAG: hypothetical protein NWQ28_06900 [Nodularia sp. (in: cyanobacteria)]|nr:hypothetical protein [Nodularia sp. (in: cyanobacteria)]